MVYEDKWFDQPRRMQDMKNANTLQAHVSTLLLVSSLALTLGTVGLSYAATSEPASVAAKANASAPSNTNPSTATPSLKGSGAASSSSPTGASATNFAASPGAQATVAKTKKVHHVSANKHSSTQHAFSTKGVTHSSTPSAKTHVSMK